MAVIPMQKVRIIAHKEGADAVLEELQRAGAMQFEDVRFTTDTDIDVAFPLAELQPRVEHAVAFLTPYERKRGLWKTLREGTQIRLTEREAKERARDIDSISDIVDDLEHVQVELAEATNEKRTLEEQIALLTPWRALTIPFEHLSTATTVTYLVSRERSDGAALEPELSVALSDAGITHATTVVDLSHVAVTVPREVDASAVIACAESVGAEVVPEQHGSGAVATRLAELQKELTKVNERYGQLHDQAEHFAILHLEKLRMASDLYRWQKDRFDAMAHSAATVHTLVFDGWIDSTKRVAIERTFETAAVPAVITDLELEPEEEPPVEIRNHPLVQPFEAVTRLYGMPGYRELDPTLFLAGFFFLFFGLSLTDVGYGLFLMAVSTLMLTVFVVPKVMRQFAKLLLMVGFATVLIGMLFGGYLGIDPAQLPAALQAVQLFDPIGDPLPVFYLALALGVIQVMVGMLLKIYSEARNGRLMAGILDQGPWLLMFCLGIFYLATTLGYVDILSTAQITNLIYVGIALIVIASGRNGENVLDMVRLSLLSLYNSIGYFSDILSYSRLLALGLATTALAFAVNLIADIVREGVPYVGAIFAILILVVGHLFTLAVNTLGAFIHSARLQFVEFFGKFIAGTGREFKPLSRSEHYVTITDD